MAEATVNTKHRRYPWLAMMLSVIMAGLGHVYCGRFVKGLVLAFLAYIPIPVTFSALLIGRSSIRIAVLIASWLLSVLVSLIAIIDSWYIAKHTTATYTLKDYNRWYVYVLWVVLSTGGATRLAFNVRANYIEAFRVPAASNYPTLAPGDRFLANKLAYRNNDPKRGDLVVFMNPQNRRTTYIKRVVAIAGDTVQIKDNELYINGCKLQRRQLSDSTSDKMTIRTGGSLLKGDVYEETNDDATYKIFLQSQADPNLANLASVTVPKYHCFVLGDNRNSSEDSRHFGPVPLGTIKGRADYLYWPAKDWSRFGSLRPK